MNKIVREHYPVSKLPEDIREELKGVETVNIVIDTPDETSGIPALQSAERAYQAYLATLQPMNLKELLADKARNPEKYRGSVTPEEAVARIRELRDEWDDDR